MGRSNRRSRRVCVASLTPRKRPSPISFQDLPLWEGGKSSPFTLCGAVAVTPLPRFEKRGRLRRTSGRTSRPTCDCVTVAVEARQEMLEEAQKKLVNLLSSSEGKIDK